MVEKTDHDRIVEMHAILCDTNGNPGLTSQFRNLKKAFYDFRLRAIIFAVVLILSTGGTAFGVLEIVKKMLGK